MCVCTTADNTGPASYHDTSKTRYLDDKVDVVVYAAAIAANLLLCANLNRFICPFTVSTASSLSAICDVCACVICG